MSTRVLVGQTGDAAEREADRVAEAALRGAGRSSVTRATDVDVRGRRDFPTPPLAARLRALDGRGAPLPDALRDYFGPRLGHDFARVRVHTDTAADETARELGAVAFAIGNNVAFASGRYAPETPGGQRLLAHELVHVAQQGDSPVRVARASYGTPGPDPRGRREPGAVRTVWHPPEEEHEVAASEAERPGEEVAVVRRQTPGGAGDAGTPDAGPQLATPSLSLAPAASLTRGDTLTASMAFRPVAGERLNVTGWSYVTAAHGTIARPTTDADFQTRWSGVMAVSGDVVVTYQLTPAGGSARPAQTLRVSVTVADRTGAQWVSVVTLGAEGTLTGQPSPPALFNQLGRHNASAPTVPQPTTTAIATGPNAQLTYVSSLTAGSFLSSPLIHPDETTPTSAFYRFHLNPSRLYLVTTAGARTLIPLTEYSGLSVSGGTVSFTVPDWEAFYKAHNFYRVTARSASGPEVVLRPAVWRLASNAQDADVEVADVVALRAALGISASEGYNFGWDARGSWEGFQLMQSPAILAGARSHEYGHATHSHRANFTKMMRALDPQRKIESTVAAPASPVDFNARISAWWTEILRPNHELVDEAASRTAERFVAAPGTMAGVNTDPTSGAFLGSVWSITGDQQMT
jgi:hypothetical protein